MRVTRLALVNFRSYAAADIDLGRGVCAFVGPNGQGKTNLVEAVDFVATQASHRVATDQPLVRVGTEQAVIRLTANKLDRELTIELEINAGRTNRARVNRGELPRARDALAILKTVFFSPDDLEIVKGDPGVRRRFLDELLVVSHPRFAGVRADYERVLKQRNTLLKSAGAKAASRISPASLATLDVWDMHLAKAGAELLEARLALTDALRPHVVASYARVADAKPNGDDRAQLAYRPSCDIAGAASRDDLVKAVLDALADRRRDEIDRGVTLAGPHRDELAFSLGALPVRGYASHGESWSFALALKLAAFGLLRAEGDDPVLILDDVFAELDELRRSRLAGLVGDTEQVLITAAVDSDVPAGLVGTRFDVRDGRVRRS